MLFAVLSVKAELFAISVSLLSKFVPSIFIDCFYVSYFCVFI